MKIRKTKDAVFFQVMSYVIIGLMALVCLIPFLLIISASFTEESVILKEGYSLWPSEFSVNAYKTIFQVPEQVFRSYLVTIFITVVGTSVGLFLTSMAAYVLNRKDFKYRNACSFYLYFTTLFSGGLVPFYILIVQYLHLKDSILSIILPTMLSVWNILLMRNFMKSIPDSLYESAKIDGAGDFRIFIRIVLPLSKASLATVGLFQALTYWNEWYNGMLFLQNEDLFPLQLFLRNMLNSQNIMNLVKSGVNISRDMIPTEGMKMAMAVLAMGPVLFFYPFVQRYFVAGMTVGSVKA